MGDCRVGHVAVGRVASQFVVCLAPPARARLACAVMLCRVWGIRHVTNVAGVRHMGHVTSAGALCPVACSWIPLNPPPGRQEHSIVQ